MLTSLECKVADMALRTLAERARMARIRAGFVNEKAAADAIGCSRPLVIRWESGEAQSIGGRYLTEAARAYKVRPEWLALTADDDGYPWDPDSGASSQPGRPDFEKIAGAVRIVHDFLAYENEPSAGVYDPVMLSIAWEVVERSGQQLTPDNVVQFVRRFRQVVAEGDAGGEERLLGRHRG